MTTAYIYEWFGERFSSPAGQDTEQVIAEAMELPRGSYVRLVDWADRPVDVFIRHDIPFRKLRLH